MCWEMDDHWFTERQKAQQKEQEKERDKQQQAQRADAIERLLSGAHTEADNLEEAAPLKEKVAAK